MAVSRGFTINFVCSRMICYFLMILAIMFNLDAIGPHNQNREMLTDGAGTYISGEDIHLTSDAQTDQISSGRATYAEQLHLWDHASGRLADFTTKFSFVMDSGGETDYGEGFSFFLAQNNSFIGAGGAMGLPVMDNSSSTASIPFVAVEFDTHWNQDWDPVDATDSPIGDHVGLNINSLISVKAEKWWRTSGRVCVAQVNYDATSQNFSVTLTGFHNNTIVPNHFELHHTVDLRTALPEWVIFGFSASSSRDHFQNTIVKSWFFNSSDPAFDYKMLRNARKKKMRLLAVEIAVGSFCVFVIFVLSFFFCCFSGKSRPEDGNEKNTHPITFEEGTNQREFTLMELAGATDNFDEGNKLGKGGFGAVYEGQLTCGRKVAVKSVSATSQQGFNEYLAEVDVLARTRHRYVVELIGWCKEEAGQLLLVNEFMAKKSLADHLFNPTVVLSWEVRRKIALGLAKALRYLHEECGVCVLHRDIKSSNVMLDSEFNPKVGDFGLAKIVEHDKSMQLSVLAGTRGYLAPECWATGRVSKESDVYSFGVVVLELATGRKTIESGAQESQIYLVEWVRNLYGMGSILAAVDPRLGHDFNRAQMEGLMIIGLWCVHPDPSKRLTMMQVVSALNNVDSPLSSLPQDMPNLAPHSAINFASSADEASISAEIHVPRNTMPGDGSLQHLAIPAESGSPSPERYSYLYGKKEKIA